MLKNIGKFMFMIELGYKYINIFKQTYFHPFITLKPAYKKLSEGRQEYCEKVLEFLNIEVKLHGELPDHDRVLYTINHRSLLDILVMENIFARKEKNGTWIAKQELFDAFYGKFFQYSGCISVDLESKRGLLSFFKKIKKTLAKVDDMNIYIFPEGERFSGDGVTAFQSGASKIAKANKLEVIPVYIQGKNEQLFKDAPYQQTQTVDVFIGSAIQPETLEEEYKAFVNSIEK